MAQTFHWVEPVECTPAVASSWEDVDLDTFIGGLGSDVTGVIIHLVSNYDLGYSLGLRKNGSTDARRSDLGFLSHCWAMIGVDSDHIFECYVEHTNREDVYIVGYTTAGVTFFDNGVDKSLATTLEWLDIDCAAQAPGATGLIFERTTGSSTDRAAGLRKNGSTDARINTIAEHDNFGAIIGCDESQICEGYIGSTVADYFLLGYVTDGATFNTNALDLSLASTADWIDLPALSAGAVGGFLEVISNSDINYGLRKNGSSEEIYSETDEHPFAFVECDSNQLIEGKIAATSIDFFEVGIATAGPSPPAAETELPVIVRIGDKELPLVYSFEGKELPVIRRG